MKTKRKHNLILAVICAIALFAFSFFAYLQFADWGFAREISFSEKLHRLHMVHTAQTWLGFREGFANHEQILQIYNNHEPLAQGYAVTVNDSWCAAFASAVAIQCRLTDIVPRPQSRIGIGAVAIEHIDRILTTDLLSLTDQTVGQIVIIR